MKNMRQPRRAAGPEDGRIQYRRNKYAAPVGGVFIILAVIGLISLGYFCFKFTSGLLDNTAEKVKFQEIIKPVVMFDPVPFEKVTDADPLFLLQSSLWSTLLGEKRASYEEDAQRRRVVPASDVDVTCARLFGPDVKLEHQTFGDSVDYNVYDPDTKSYYVPVTAMTQRYTPNVLHVVKKGDLFTLTVGYIPPSNAWTQAIDGKTGQPESDKKMIYELLKVKDHYQLNAIQDVPLESVGSDAERLGLVEGFSSTKADSPAETSPASETAARPEPAPEVSSETSVGTGSGEGEASDGETSDQAASSDATSSGEGEAPDGEASSDQAASSDAPSSGEGEAPDGEASSDQAASSDGSSSGEGEAPDGEASSQSTE